MRTVIAALLLAAAAAHADEAPTAVPEGFAIDYETGPVAADMGDEHFLRLRPDGRGYKLTVGHLDRRGGEEKEVIDRVIFVSDERVLQVYQEVARQRFFTLKPEYASRAPDGGVERLIVRDGGRRKRVVVRNLRVHRFHAVARTLWILGK